MSLPKLQAHLAVENLASIAQLAFVIAFVPIWIFRGFGAAILICGLGIWGFQVMRPGPNSGLDQFTGRGD